MLQYLFCIRKNAFYLCFFVRNFSPMYAIRILLRTARDTAEALFSGKILRKKTHGPMRSRAFFFEKIG